MLQRTQITRKKKICKGRCGKPKYIFSNGMCKTCWAAEYLKKKNEKLKEQYTKDELFYAGLWERKKQECFECGCTLSVPKDTPKNKITFVIRWYIHHICPKSKYAYLRYIEENTVFFCKFCHGKAESAIDYPKLKCYNELERIKKELLGV